MRCKSAELFLKLLFFNCLFGPHFVRAELIITISKSNKCVEHNQKLLLHQKLYAYVLIKIFGFTMF